MLTSRRRIRQSTERIKDSVNVPALCLLWVLKREKTDVCVRVLNPQAHLQAAHWEKNNSAQAITHSLRITASVLLRTRGKVKLKHLIENAFKVLRQTGQCTALSLRF